MVVLSFVLLTAVSFGEAWAVGNALPLSEHVSDYIQLFSFLSIGLFMYSFVMARLMLHMIYHMEHARLVQTSVLGGVTLCYCFIMWRSPQTAAVTFLATSKVLGMFLFSSFWKVMLLEEFWRRQNSAHVPRTYLVSWKAFFICRWVLLASWLILNLGLALALIAEHPVIQLDIWEGLILLLTFFVLFQIFAKNPNAHFEMLSSKKS